jgi:hypothetical protein
MFTILHTCNPVGMASIILTTLLSIIGGAPYNNFNTTYKTI